MAQLFGREPAASTTQENTKPPVTAAGGRGGSTGRIRVASAGEGGGSGRIDRLRNNIDDIVAELRKVTWPTPDETRNLTIVVIGISVGMGLFLGGVDLLLASLYTLINP